MLVRFVSIVEAQNNPVYFKSFGSSVEPGQGAESEEDRIVNERFVAEMSLDFIQTLSRASKADTAALLIVNDGIAVYGSLANTGVKFLVGIDALSKSTVEMESLIRGIQDSYVSFVCNPFYDESNPVVSSKKIEEKIQGLVHHAEELANL